MAGGLFGRSFVMNEKQEKNKDIVLDTQRRHYLIYGMHIVLIVPLLAYLAIYKQKVNPIIYPILGVLAVFTAGYHGTAMMMASH